MRERISQVKRKPTEWEIVIAKYTPDTALISRAYKELKNPSQEIK